MPTLADALQLEARHELLITHCVALIQQQVERRTPLRRIPLKAALAMLESFKPQALRGIVGRLLPEFADALDPLYQRFVKSDQQQFSPFLQAHSDEAVDALLGVADARARQSDRGAIRTAYARLRPSAENEVRAVLPALADLLSSQTASDLSST